MDIPLAYFITFHTYATWLPGDPRGSVDARQSGLGSPYVRSPSRHASSAWRLEQRPVALDDRERTIILGAFEEVCHHRGWVLRAADVRTNHVHVVVSAEHTPERVMNDLKAWSTRRIVDAALRPRGVRLWVRHGSTRYLWRPRHVDAACAYAVEDQGADRSWARRSDPGSAC